MTIALSVILLLISYSITNYVSMVGIVLIIAEIFAWNLLFRQLLLIMFALITIVRYCQK